MESKLFAMKTFRKFSFPRSVFFTLVLFGAMAAAAASKRFARGFRL